MREYIALGNGVPHIRMRMFFGFDGQNDLPQRNFMARKLRAESPATYLKPNEHDMRICGTDPGLDPFTNLARAARFARGSARSGEG